MHASFLVFAAVGLFSQAFAFPQILDSRQDANAVRPWTAPGSGDVRSPCPGLNTLANHGYINHNGRGISKQSMQQGFLDAFGLAFGITNPGGDNAVNLQCTRTPGNCPTFDLDTLNTAHQIEHDGSLTRDDAREPWSSGPWDNHSFNQTRWDETLELYGCNDHVDPELANYVRTTRLAQAQAEDPNGWFVRNDGGSIAEHGFTLAAMNDPYIGTPSATRPSARLDWIKAWYSQERLPTALGWHRPDTVSEDIFNQITKAIGNGTLSSVVPKSVCAASKTSSSSSTLPTSTSSSSSSLPSVPSTSKSSSIVTTSSSKLTTTGVSSGTGSSPTSTDIPPFPAGNSTTPAASGSGTGVGTTSISKTSAITGPSTPGNTLSTVSGKPIPVSSVASDKPITTDKPTDKPASTGTSTTSATVPASVSSSAQAKATELAGPAPAQPNAYKDVLTPEQWSSFSVVINKYITVIQNICYGLIGSHEVGSMPLSGVSGSGSSGGGAPWMQPGGSMSAGPSNPSSPSSPTSGAANPNTPSNPSSPSSPTSPAGSGTPGYGSCQCQC